MIEKVLTYALDPRQGVSPDQLNDIMEMMITDLHLRKSQGQFWLDVLPMCIRGVKLSAQISAETRLSRTPGLDPAVVKTIESAIDISIQEINSLRAKLLVKLEVLKQCPNEGAQIH